MITRKLQGHLQKLAKQYPVVPVTGPRQSGKTTLCRKVFPKYSYVSFENPDLRQYATEDPRKFLAEYSQRVIFDEIQRVPDLSSYLQELVDSRKENGQFILTGSQNFQISQTVSQSLAGRTALLKLMPFSMEEISIVAKEFDLNDLLLTGFYPRIHDEKLSPTKVMADYFETYVERDVRTLVNIKDLSVFQRFVRLCAGRVGQILSLSSLGNDVGISHSTAREWMSLLEASYIVFLLPPHYRNYSKRIVKSPKLYFYDVGLASYLLELENSKQVQRDPLRGNLFENLVVIEFLKQRFNDGRRSNLYFFRDSNGNEVDLVLSYGHELAAIEIKSAQTVVPDFFKGLDYFERVSKDTLIGKAVVFGGDQGQKRTGIDVVSYTQCGKIYRKYQPE